MEWMNWTWDPDKNQENQRKHGIGFEAAALVFDNLNYVTREDDYQYEQRWQTIGRTAGRLVVVVHTWPAREGEPGRIISARKPEPYEIRRRKMVKLTEEQKRQLEALDKIPDDEIDFSDIPRITDWSGFRMGLFHRPKWADFSLKLDEYITDWFEGGLADGETLGEAINKALGSEEYRIRFPLRVLWVEELVQQIKESPEKVAEVTGWQGDQVKAMYNMPVEEFVVSDVPLKPAGRSRIKAGTSRRPVIKDITLKLDENVVDWYEWYEEGQPRDEVLSKALMAHIQRVESLRGIQQEKEPAGRAGD